MKSFAVILVASTALISLSAAQVYEPVNPEDIDYAVRERWCSDQFGTCEGLCQDQEQVPAGQNECDPETLVYTCVCENDKTPSPSIPRLSTINCVSNLSRTVLLPVRVKLPVQTSASKGGNAVPAILSLKTRLPQPAPLVHPILLIAMMRKMTSLRKTHLPKVKMIKALLLAPVSPWVSA